MKKLIGTVALVLVAAGCNTSMYGSAPAKEGYVYVVGSRQNMPTVWLCPSTANKGECKTVTVNEEEH